MKNCFANAQTYAVIIMTKGKIKMKNYTDISANDL